MKGKLPDVDVGAIECLDNFTLKFRFTKTSAVPLLGFANAAAMIFNKEWFQAGGEDARARTPRWASALSFGPRGRS